VAVILGALCVAFATPTPGATLADSTGAAWSRAAPIAGPGSWDVPAPADAGRAGAGAPPATSAAGPASSTPRLQFVAVARPSSELQRLLREDQQWLERLPAASRRLGVPEDTTGARVWLAGLVGEGAVARPSLASRRPGEAGTAAADSAAPAQGSRGALSLLRDRWLARGRLAVVVAAESTATAGVSIAIDPGPDFRVGAVRVEGPDFPGRGRLIEATLPRAGDRFRAADWTAGVAQLLAGAGEAGYPFARWVARAVRVDPSRAQVDVNATLFTGERSVLGRQSSDLPAGRGEAFLRRASGMRMGATFRESDLRRGRDRLLERGIYADVGEPVVYIAGRGDTVGVHWPIVPVAHPNRFAAVLGFSRPDAGAATRLSGQADLALPNLAGTGRRLTAGWSDDGAGRSHVGISWLEPLVLRSPLDLEGTLDDWVVRDSYTRFTADLRARLALVAAWGLEVGLGWDRSTFPTGDWTNSGRQRARAAFYHRRGDLARSGWSGVFAYETAVRHATVRQDTTATGAIVTTGEETADSERQNLVELSWDGELFATPEASFAARWAVDQVTGQGGPIPVSEQYWFGGARSVRGYLEDQFHGEQTAYGSLEFRLGKPGRSRIYTFLDMGYYRFATTAVDSSAGTGKREGTVRGFGLGLATHTGGSDISLAIGFPGNLDFDQAKLHVTLLQSF
jgi:hypothetical protein